MVKLTLTLNSRHSKSVYSKNGKLYKLRPGTNTLELEYADYVALAKALSITPVENPDENSVAKEDNVSSEETLTASNSTTEMTDTHSEETTNDCSVEKESESTQVSTDEDLKVCDDSNKSSNVIDYSTWSFNKLKSEYKSITGSPCKLKKDEVIAFLQEHGNV